MERVETHWRKGARILCRDPCRRPTRLHFSIRAYNHSRLGNIPSANQPPPPSSELFFLNSRFASLFLTRQVSRTVGIGGVPGSH